MKKFAYAWILMVLLLAGCRQEESVYVAEEDETITVNYEVEIGDGTDSRVIGDGSRVDQLVVGIFRDGSLVTTLTFADDADGTKDGKFQNIAIPMMRTETYDLAFWAQKNGNGIYDINEDNFQVNINYAAYNEKLQEVENYDAFSGKKLGVSAANPGAKNITLTRPFAQLNVGANGDVSSVSQVVMQVQEVPNVYCPLNGSMTGATTCEFEFKFDDNAPNSGSQLETADGIYSYLASAYLLPVTATGVKVLITQGNVVHTLEVDDVTLQAKQRTNIVGDFLN